MVCIKIFERCKQGAVSKGSMVVVLMAGWWYMTQRSQTDEPAQVQRWNTVRDAGPISHLCRVRRPVQTFTNVSRSPL